LAILIKEGTCVSDTLVHIFVYIGTYVLIMEAACIILKGRNSSVLLFYLNNGGNMFIRKVRKHIPLHVDVYILITEIWCFPEIFTFAPCMLLHLLYSKPTHALLLNTPSRLHFKTLKLLKKSFVKTSLKPYM
jgi:hypothetical protein